MLKFWVGSLLSMVGSFTLAFDAQANPSSSVTVEVEGLRDRKGQVCLSVFANSQGFPGSSTKAVQKQCVKVTEAPIQVTFSDLQPGNYAIAVLHDENGDGQANRNFLGIPTEGFGFSDNPAIGFGPPSFADSSFLVAGPSTRIQIQLNYLLGG
jgi:uncharacterized protein (DUF2141 family)